THFFNLKQAQRRVLRACGAVAAGQPDLLATMIRREPYGPAHWALVLHYTLRRGQPGEQPLPAGHEPPRVLLPEKAKPFCLSLDELPASAPDIQKTFSSLLLERRRGGHYLPRGTWVVAAGNRQGRSITLGCVLSTAQSSWDWSAR